MKTLFYIAILGALLSVGAQVLQDFKVFRPKLTKTEQRLKRIEEGKE